MTPDPSAVPPSPEPSPPESPPEADSGSSELKAAQDIQQLLVICSALLALVAAFLDLDYLPGSVLGSAVVGFNLHWTISFVRSLLESGRVSAGLVLVHLLKFGASVLVLYLALNPLGVPPLGLLLGLSNIVFAVAWHSVRRQTSSSRDSEPSL